ncbi:MAG: response regulator [Planctomycetota bacterium]|nr:MAG: response regulator [Planctomycetota bacterium]REJ88952.1 MAG: response regulator [Planctomycetota bacterium]REK18043.1 MAG: response regulator [Planctomycetota bacterium]REK42342.1 MAG: response regulator [Planctomycetota bacterium]
MKNALRLAIVDPNDSARESLKALLLGMESVWLEAECSQYDFFADVVEQTTPDVGVIGMDSDPERALRLIQELQQTHRNCQILVVSGSTDGQLILQAMRAGAKEFLALPLAPEDVVQALERIGQTGQSDGHRKNMGSKVIAVAGATGGVGTTSLAVNLGCCLAAVENHSVVLVDLDLCLGDADVCLDAIPDYTLVDVAQNAGRMDFTLLKRSLTKHASGLYLLPRPVQLDDVSEISPDDMGKILGLLKATFSHVILDLSKSFGPIDRVALAAADHVLLVTQLDLPCLRNVVRLMMSFNEMESLASKIKIVVNRFGMDDHQIGLKKAQETIGRDIFWQLPNDYRVMVDVRNNGIPLIEQAPRAAITQSIRKLATTLTGGEAEEPVEASSGIGRWLNLLSGKQQI